MPPPPPPPPMLMLRGGGGGLPPVEPPCKPEEKRKSGKNCSVNFDKLENQSCRIREQAKIRVAVVDPEILERG